MIYDFSVFVQICRIRRLTSSHNVRMQRRTVHQKTQLAEATASPIVEKSVKSYWAPWGFTEYTFSLASPEQSCQRSPQHERDDVLEVNLQDLRIC